MAKRLQLRRGTTAQTNAFLGALSEVTVDTDKDVLVVHDGVTLGGFPVAARANANGTISLIKKDGTVITTIPATGLFNNTLTSTATDQALTAAQGKVLSDSKLDKTSIVASGTAPYYVCRAWVNFNGTGTPTIRASGNVSSITDNGVGDYTINFTTAMPDANYVVTETHSAGSGGQHAASLTLLSTGSVRLNFSVDSSNSYPAVDPSTATVGIIR